MPASDHASISRRRVEDIMNKGRLDVAEEIFTRTYVEHDPFNPPDLGKGPAFVRQHAAMYRTAFPDLKCTVEAVYSVGDHVVMRWSAMGTQKGPLGDLQPRNKKAKVTGITIDRFSGDKIAESWTSWDSLGLLQQLGVVAPNPLREKIKLT